MAIESAVLTPATPLASNGDPELALDSNRLVARAEPGADEHTFVVKLLNVSPRPKTVVDVKTSCGCTVAQLPRTPWVIQPGQSDELRLVMDLRGKSGLLSKTASIETDRGVVALSLEVTVPAVAPMSLGGRMRERDQDLAKADRQAVFAPDCMSCHALPTAGRFGEALYRSACGICHDAEHRAAFVPALRELNRPPDRDYWRTMIVAGKPGTLMPGFSADMGGPLNRAQIDSLVDYLVSAVARRPGAVP